MKQLHPLIICILLIPLWMSSIFAQTTFEKTYHEGSGNYIQQTSDNGYLLLTDDSATKTDENGNLIWTKMIDNPMNGFVPTSDGGFVKTGTIDQGGNGQTDIVISKMDADGIPVWTKILGNQQPESATGVHPTSDGGYLIVGQIEQTVPFVFMYSYEYFFDDMLLLKTDANGNELWRKVVGDVDSEELGLMVTETNDGNYVAVGTKSMDSPPATFFPGLIIFKTDQNGNELDLYIEGNPGVGIHPKTLKPTFDGGYLIACDRWNFSPHGASALYVIKKDGTSEWNYLKGGSQFNPAFGHAAAPTLDGGAIITGKYSDMPIFGAPIIQLATLFKLDDNGNEEWETNQIFPGNDITATSDGGYAITGEIGGLLNLVKVGSDGLVDRCPNNIAGFTVLGELNEFDLYIGDKHQYFTSNEAYNWHQAQSMAAANKGYLASIFNAEENDFLQQNITEQVFIGLNDEQTEGDLEWDSGNPFYYSNLSTCDWCGLNSDENDFGKMNFWDGSWSFDNQLVERPFLLEVDCESDCGCPTDYDPVCASNGETYANACLAECDRQFDYTVGVCQAGCPQTIAGYEFLGEWNGHHYFLSETGKPWWMAETDALSLGGYLATVGSADENDFLQQHLSEIVWFGMTDSNTEGQVEWSNGDHLTYTKYSTCDFCGDNTDGNDYGEMNFWDGSWSWDNGTPYRKFLVEIPCWNNTLQNNPAVQIAILETTEENEKPQTVVEKLFPNPATNHLFAKIESTTETEIIIQIYDAMGRLYLEKSATLFNGTNHLEMDIADLPSGVYALFVNDSQRQISQMKFVKQQM